MPTVGQSTGTAQDALGYVWQYTYRGKPYTYFFDDPVIGNAAKLTHAELTGDIEPAAVTNRANAAVASELREANFAHQLASACYKASTTWATMLGIISVRSPDDHGPANVASWIGDLPGYEYVGDTLVIDGAAKNGVGLLGNKFHAGEDGYRTGQITGGTSEGYAYGGYIMTTGAALPPGDPYGIDDSDEALDLQSKPIDIGKHILVTAAWPLHVTEGYRGSLCNSLAAKIALTPENEEPIGVNGGMLDVNMTSQVRGPQINDLAKLRFVGLRFEPRVGQILVSVRTAAHPTSDWARLSTIRSVNRTLSALRSIAKPYIGKGFNALSLQSLQQSMDGFLQSDRKLGFNQGAVATLSYSTLDKIAGRLKIKLKMIPPFTLETIEVETTLAAEEAQLS
jgi:hypothetical protein